MQALAGMANQRVVVGAIASSCLMATSEALSERHEHDQRVESVLRASALSRLTR